MRGEIESRFGQLKLHFFRNDTPRGPSFSRNLAARAIESDYVWFIDSDSEIVNSHILVDMIRILDSDRRIGAVGGILEGNGDGRQVMELEILTNFLFLYRSFPPQEYSPRSVDGISTTNLFLKQEMFDCVGGFWEDLRRDEDNDLCLELRKRGYSIYQDSETLTWHKLSDAGRESGAFAHFTDQTMYLKDLLETRAILLAQHVPWRLLVLPVLDAFLLPMVIYRIKSGKYVIDRFRKAVSETRLKWICSLVVRYIGCYIWGLGLFVRKPFGLFGGRKVKSSRGKNIFLSRLFLFDRLYPTVVKLPRFLRSQIAHYISKYLRRRLKKHGLPDRLTIFITDRCNLRCRHCFVATGTREESPEMGPREYQRFFRKARGVFSQVLFTGGEPATREDLGDIIVSASRYGAVPSCTIFTNCTLQERLLNAVRKAIDDSPIHLSFQVSVDGPESFHDANRGVKGAFRKTLEMMDTLRELKKRHPTRVGRLISATAISRRNLNELPHVIDIVRERGFLPVFTFVRSSKAHVFNVSDSQQVSDFAPVGFEDYLTAEEMDEAFEIIQERLWARERHNLVLATNRIILKTIVESMRDRVPKTSCYSGFADIILLPDGDVARCEMLRRFANLREFDWDLARLMQSSAFQDHCKEVRGCWCTHDCSVGLSIMYDEDLLKDLFDKVSVVSLGKSEMVHRMDQT